MISAIPNASDYDAFHLSDEKKRTQKERRRRRRRKKSKEEAANIHLSIQMCFKTLDRIRTINCIRHPIRSSKYLYHVTGLIPCSIAYSLGLPITSIYQ